MRKRFTKWYFKRGYRFGYKVDNGVAVWDCPWWVKPLLIFFSPSVYFYELWNNNARYWRIGYSASTLRRRNDVCRQKKKLPS